MEEDLREKHATNWRDIADQFRFLDKITRPRKVALSRFGSQDTFCVAESAEYIPLLGTSLLYHARLVWISDFTHR